MQGEAPPDKTYKHVAFKIDNAEFDMYLKRIQSLGLQFSKGRSRVEGEGRSIYFSDYDNYMFELHTGTLNGRLKRYEKSP